jgi:hypothetical protein
MLVWKEFAFVSHLKNYMLKGFSILFWIFIIWVFAGCTYPENDTTIIANLVKKYPQLKDSSESQINKFNIIRSIELGQTGIRIKLYSQDDMVDEKQQILILTNSKEQSYPVILPSNSFHDYWGFYFDEVRVIEKNMATTFEKELNMCLETLNLNDSIGTAGKVVNEIFTSLLHCKEVNINDSSELKIVLMKFYRSKTIEETDSCSKRVERNWTAISKDMFPNETIVYKENYFDRKNGRIYQLDYKDFKRNKKNYFKINVFRQDCYLGELPDL